MEKRREVKKAPSRIIDTAKEYRSEHKKESMGRPMPKGREHHKMDNRVIDNGRVKDNHQEGIGRVMQRKGDLDVGQGGKMYNSPERNAEWRRSEGSLTPRKA